MDWQRVRGGIGEVIAGLGLNTEDPNFKDTADRVTRAYQEIFAGLDNGVPAQVDQILQSTFPCAHEQMVIAKRIEIFSLCPHHLLPVRYQVTIGYLPTEHVLGLSKLARLAKLLAARPVLQEQVVNDITTALMRVPGCRGAGCIAEGEHFCMIMRGVKQSHSLVTTSSLQGEFLIEADVRAEFMSLSR